MIEEKIRKIAELGNTYKKEYLFDKYDRNQLLNDWWKALKFYFDRTFMRGRNDELSAKFEEAAITALERDLGTDLQQKEEKLNELNKNGWLSETKFSDEHNPLQKLLKSAGVNHHGDRLMVINTLAFILHLDEKNVVKWAIQKIKTGAIEEAHRQLDGIKWIGVKLSPLFLRDVVSLFGLEQYLSPETHVFVQPIDTWVRQVVRETGIIMEKLPDGELKRKIVETCLKHESPPIEFNQGAWYYGFHLSRGKALAPSVRKRLR